MKEIKFENKAMRRAKQVAESYADEKQVLLDPNGSWTGVPRDASEVPTQDADDL